MKDLVAEARALAEHLLADAGLGTRWQHVQAVGRQAENLAVTVASGDRPTLIAAAWLHDIGYSPALVDTGLHALDGARYLRRRGFPDRVVGLVAHHTGAWFEAVERGLTPELERFLCDNGALADAITAADLTTGPAGQSVTVRERIDEILRRYPQSTFVHRAVLKARPTLEAHVERTLARLAEGSSSPSAQG